MDGLIFNTEDIYRDAVMATAADANHDVPLTFYLSTVGLTGAAARLAFIERYGEGFDYDTFWSTASNRFAEMARSQLRLKAGVVELLDLLDKLGLPRAICTSSRHEDVRNNLADRQTCREISVRHRTRRLHRQQAASRTIPESGGTVRRRAGIMRGAGRSRPRHPLRIRRRE